MGRVGEEGGEGGDLEDGDAHEPDVVVGQQLDLDVGGPHKGQGDGAHIGGHGGQSQLYPQLALQVQVAHQHRQLHENDQCVQRIDSKLGGAKAGLCVCLGGLPLAIFQQLYLVNMSPSPKTRKYECTAVCWEGGGGHALVIVVAAVHWQ